MANYNIKQVAYSGIDQCLTPFDGTPGLDAPNTGKLTPTNYRLDPNENKPSEWGDQYTPYQQIVLNGSSNQQQNSFNMGTSYYLELEIPKDDNYDLDFALLLIPQPKVEGTDLDQLNYQFIRYLHVPQSSGHISGQSRVVLYEAKDATTDSGYSGDVKVAIAKMAPNLPDSSSSTEEEQAEYLATHYDANSIYYQENTEKYMWTTSEYTGAFNSNQEYYGYTDIVLSHSWKSQSSSSEIARFEIIFTPRVSDMKCLYLYLIPTKADNDVQWLNRETDPPVTYYGRHVDVSKINAYLFSLKNLLTENSMDLTARRIGVWGRSELMLAINGEEIKVGPSNYYELQNFAITNLGVAAKTSADRFTIDLQY